MNKAGHIALAPFPYTDLSTAKKRPVLLIKALKQGDYLACMISSRLNQADLELDYILTPEHIEFERTGLKVASVFRLSRLAVLDTHILLGSLGSIEQETLDKIKDKIAQWLVE